jgi:hypothetical protein
MVTDASSFVCRAARADASVRGVGRPLLLGLLGIGLGIGIGIGIGTIIELSQFDPDPDSDPDTDDQVLAV